MAGRDKLTLITPAPLDTLGLWVEQLVAESTGKEGKGIVPIAGEPRIDAKAYGKDRVFVAVRLRKSDETSHLRELTAAGHPVIDIVLEDAPTRRNVFEMGIAGRLRNSASTRSINRTCRSRRTTRRNFSRSTSRAAR
jgi:hypothetical protein